MLYQRLLAATLQLAVLLSDDQHQVHHPSSSFDHLALLCRLEGKGSMASISALVKHLGYQPHSVGHLSQSLQPYGPALPATVAMASQTVVCYLSEDIFAIHTPIVVTIAPQSTTMLHIERATDRSASTWKTHFETLKDHHVHSLGMASERGLGLVAGDRDAGPEALWVADHLHACQGLCNVRLQWAHKASSARAQEDEAIRQWHHAKSASHLNKRLTQYAPAHHACEPARVRYDQLDTLLPWLQEA